MDETQYIIKSMTLKINLLPSENDENVPDDDDVTMDVMIVFLQLLPTVMMS